jgi:predicted ATPase/DNA-binding NarL/FixJ family response regulator
MQVTSSQRLYTLPSLPNTLIGREHELEAITRTLESSEVRLLTLLGTAGVGKTRLVIAAAHELASAFEDGICFVSLASVREASLVMSVVAQALGLQTAGKVSLLERLKTYLRERRICLVLDNLEHLTDSAPQLSELLTTCPNLTLLVTSRVRLNLRWETTLLVTPLELPSGDSSPRLTLAQAPAIKLFTERVQAVTPAFALTDENAQAVSKLCKLLDGLPLALELAAAHANVLTPEAMMTRWQHHLPSLGWNASDLPARQRTLRDAIAWSYNLLSKSEQELFRKLGVFAGGFTLEAAEAVTRHEKPLESLTNLVNASLVKVIHAERGQTRFDLLESLRDYARERLESEGELGTVQHHHALYFADFAKRAARAVKGEGQLEWFKSLDEERDNFRAALAWATAQQDADVFLQLFINLSYFWWTRGYLHEGEQWLEEALEQSSKKLDPLRLETLEASGLLMGTLGNYEAAKAKLEEALTLARGFNDRNKYLSVLSHLMLVSWLSGRHEDTPTFANELTIWRENSDTWAVAFALHGLGLLADESAEPKARVYLEESLRLFREVGDDYRAVAVISTLAAATYNSGDVERALVLAAEALETGRNLHNQRTIAFASDILLLVQGQSTTAFSRLAILLGAVDALRVNISFHRPPRLETHYQTLVAQLQTALGKATYEKAWTAGRTLTLEALVTELLETTAEKTPASLLSSRERDVLELVAQGFSNKKIAKQLRVSPSTVNFHLTSIFNKLEVNSRVQAVTVAVERGLLQIRT